MTASGAANGGALSFVTFTDPRLGLEGVTFSENQAFGNQAFGGAVEVQLQGAGSVRIVGAAFVDNRIESASGSFSRTEYCPVIIDPDKHWPDWAAAIRRRNKALAAEGQMLSERTAVDRFAGNQFVNGHPSAIEPREDGDSAGGRPAMQARSHQTVCAP